LIADDDYPHLSFISPEQLEEWKERAQLAGFGADKPILEDGTEVSGSEESSDRSEEITDAYTPYCPTVEEERISEVTMRILIESERAGDPCTVSGDAWANVLPR
jgi:hypothetical protein